MGGAGQRDVGCAELGKGWERQSGVNLFWCRGRCHWVGGVKVDGQGWGGEVNCT